jgi:hypothetical protein
LTIKDVMSGKVEFTPFIAPEKTKRRFMVPSIMTIKDKPISFESRRVIDKSVKDFIQNVKQGNAAQSKESLERGWTKF